MGLVCLKASLDRAVRSMACELATKKTRIDSIAPGIVRTAIGDEVLKTLSPEATDKIF